MGLYEIEGGHLEERVEPLIIRSWIGVAANSEFDYERVEYANENTVRVLVPSMQRAFEVQSRCKAGP